MEHDLPTLREWWSSAYWVSYNVEERTFRAVRRDTGAVLEDATTEGLWRKIRDDCAAAPVVV